jgi:Raf kinase inhibitor-like YbhB/YbcL family protein
MAEFTLESSAFEHGGTIPARYTCDGDDLSPPLRWTDVPESARSLALVVEDRDAPGGVFTHWIGWGLDPAGGGLAEGEAPPGEGRNDFGTIGYRGPCPPPGHGRHRYVFRLYALDGDPGPASGTRRADFDRALEGRVAATAEHSGGYERQR